MEATPSFWIGCPDETGDAAVVIDYHQTFTYAHAAWCTGVWGPCGASFLEFNDVSCPSDRPIAGQSWSRNGGTAWSDPVTDGAIWTYSGNRASTEFLGMLPTKVDVGRPGPLRDIAQDVTGRGVPGRLGRPFRTIRVEGTVFATTRAGMIFGLDWLERIMAQPSGYGTWFGCRLACPGVPMPNGRTLFADVTLTGFTVLDSDKDVCCDFIRDVEIVFTVAQPYAFVWPEADHLTLFAGSGSDDSDLDTIGAFV